jgi:putative phosphoesterase
MKRIAILSDVHANLPALQAVLADIEGRDLDGTYCLGDLVGYGGDPNGVINLVRASGIPTILGNYDQGVGWETGDCGCSYPDEKAKQMGEASYVYTASAVTSENKTWLRGLPRERHLELEGTTIHLVHGSPRRISEYLLRERDERTYERLAASETDDVLVFGHTHQFWQRRFGHVVFVNVGTVGRPKDGDPRAGYVMLGVDRPNITGADITAELVRIGYEVEAAARGVLEAGLPASLAEGLRAGH